MRNQRNNCTDYLGCLTKDNIKDFYECFREKYYDFFVGCLAEYSDSDIRCCSYKYCDETVFTMSRHYAREFMVHNINNSETLIHQINFQKKLGIMFFLVGHYLPIKPVNELEDDIDIFDVNMHFFQFLSYALYTNQIDNGKEDKNKMLDIIELFANGSEKFKAKIKNIFISSSNTANNSSLMIECFIEIMNNN